MEVTRAIACACTVHARLSEDGTFLLSLRSQAPYSEDGLATAEITVDSEAAKVVQEAMQEILEAQHEDLARRVDHAATIERQRAIERGEVAPDTLERQPAYAERVGAVDVEIIDERDGSTRRTPRRKDQE